MTGPCGHTILGQFPDLTPRRAALVAIDRCRMTDEAHAQAAEVAVARETRLTRLEEDVKKLKPKGKDGWDMLQAVTPLLAGILLAFVSYFLSGSVNPLAMSTRVCA